MAQTHRPGQNNNNNAVPSMAPKAQPVTEIVENPNPRANENIRDEEDTVADNDTPSLTGSEITDGEDG